MHQLSNDTSSWNLIVVPPPSSLLYNSNTYESMPHNSTTGNDINNLILPISSLVNSQPTTNETNSVNYWALTLIIFPLFTIVGNALVVISVYREKSLHTVTNYFVVSLAISDITVAAVVMPFAIYLEFNRVWELSDRLCDFWVASDCMACTASILNLVAIAVDRYIAVTKPLKYARHKSPRRVAIMIVIVWLTSFCIALPIVGGVNKSDVIDYPRVPEQCAFFNNKFLIFSSLGSFFIPCIIIFAIYYRIFVVIMRQARKNRKQFRPKTIIESSAAHHRTNADHLITSYYQERPSTINQTSITSPIDLNETSPIHINTSLESQRNSLMLKLSTPVLSSGLCPLMNVVSATSEQNDDDERDDISFFVPHEQTNGNNKNQHEKQMENISPNIINFKTKNRSSQTDIENHCHYPAKRVKTRLKAKINSDGSAVPTTVIASTNNVRVAKRKAYSRMKKERKATQTLIIVLICWLPFFVLNNIVNAFVKLSKKSTAFLVNDFILSLCVWLGYINSFLNPIIYTIFNMEFRKAFAKILFSSCRFSSSS
ncbi:unnamed protein product [Rotaria sp. Silwood1]|nr:unnamed protein product [Rotaria sp. Silwood1]CAF3535912.1 unnamed protein product [Rotaria sp. Silwood1]CAF3541292.1 unnamed protein product [Rotaria sp. Silwood1]CAF4591355.1 unnamed protein product [Rotaria sp. Silwood1]CAF4780273.1 unnamed protein product [Rotaria sp. Silwood1]